FCQELLEAGGGRGHGAIMRAHAHGVEQRPRGSCPLSARPGRFELPTPGSVDQCSIQLSYGRIPLRQGGRDDTLAKCAVNAPSPRPPLTRPLSHGSPSSSPPHWRPAASLRKHFSPPPGA